MSLVKAKAATNGQKVASFPEKTEFVNARSLPQPAYHPQQLAAAIDRLLARALALAFFELDYTAEIELARWLAEASERRAA